MNDQNKDQADYKELTTIVPGWANWSTVDADGSIWVWRDRPTVSLRREWWNRLGLDYCLRIGIGPKPKDWRKEIYRLVADE